MSGVIFVWCVQLEQLPSTLHRPEKREAVEHIQRTDKKREESRRSENHKGTTLAKEDVEEKICSDVTYGTNVKAFVATLYSEGVLSNDRIAAFLNAASGDVLELSEGSVYGFRRKAELFLTLR